MFEISFADNLRILRLKRHFTQKELAQLVGIHQSVITDYEKGNNEPKVKIAIKLAKIFDTTVEELYSGQAEENEQTTAEQLVDGQTGEENGKESNLERQM